MNLPFESSVILEGSKTKEVKHVKYHQFESSVILEGSKTNPRTVWPPNEFESSVILEGSKTGEILSGKCLSLRVVLF